MALCECFQWSAHRAESRKCGCCSWRPYRAVLPTCKYFHFSGFLLRTQFSLLSYCSNSSNSFLVALFHICFSLCSHDFPGVVFTPPVGYSRPLSAVNDPSVTIAIEFLKIIA